MIELEIIDLVMGSIPIQVYRSRQAERGSFHNWALNAVVYNINYFPLK
jgi:hypothetical protein